MALKSFLFFVDFVQFKPHHIFRMRAVSTCWRTSLINIRMAGMADLLPSYGGFFLNKKQKQIRTIHRQITGHHGGRRAAADRPLRQEARRPLQVERSRAEPGDPSGGRLETQAQVLFHESVRKISSQAP